MSDKKNGISPFKDPAFLKGSDKTRRSEVSAEDIDEFKKAFSDDDDVREFTPAKNSVKAESAASDSAPEATEDLYAVQSVDIDAFIASLTGKKAPAKQDKASARHTEKSRKASPASERTKNFNLNDSFKKRINEIAPLPGEEKNIKKNVRVLVKSKQSDRHILDKLPDEEEKTNIIDVLNTKKGEDIFDAVDKAVTKDSSSAALAAALENRSKSAKKKRDQQAILTGKALRSSLIKQNKTQRIQLIFCFALFFTCLILSILPSFYSEGNTLEFMFRNGGRLFGILNVVALIPLVGVFFKSFLSGAKSIKNLSPNSDCTLFIVTFFVLIHNTATLILGTAGLGGAKTYTCFAVFAAGVNCLADYFKTRTALGSLSTVMKSKSLQSVQPIDRKKDAASVAKGISDKDDLNILYSTDVEISDSLTEGIGPRHSETKFYSYSSLAVIICGFILALISFAVSKSVTQLLTVLLSVICFCSPVTVNAACSLLNYLTNYKLNKEGAAATDNEGVHLVGKTHGVAMDVSDIFTAEVSSFRLIPGVLMKQNAAALIASAVLVNAKTLPGRCFEDFVKQIDAQLPLTENLQYEERLGFSAWVSGKRVLVGNREMLIQHSIPAPDEREEKHYGMNKFVMYLVVEGRLVASFLVNYKALSSVKKLTDEFNKTGLVLILTGKEPFLDHKEIAKRLSLESAAVKVLSGKNEAIINSYRSSKTAVITNGLVCSKAGHGLLSLVVKAYNLYISDKFLFNIHIAGQLIALVLLILASFLNMPVFFSPFTIICLELIWSICSYIITSQKTKAI